MITRRHFTAACALSLLKGAPTRAAPPLRITFINPGRLNETFWIMAEQTMRAAAQNLSIDLEVLQTNRDRLKIRDLGLSVAARANPPDVLVIANEEQSAADIVLAAGKVNLPTFLLVTDLVGEDAQNIGAPRTRVPSYLGSITPDNVAGGRCLAEAVFAAARRSAAYRAEERTHLLAIAGDQTTPSSVDRVTGLHAALQAAPDMVLERTLFANWNVSDAQTLSKRYIEWARRANQQTAAVWAATDAMALGAMDAFAEAGLVAGQDVVFGGVNWSREGVQAVADGRMAASVGGHFFCGAWSMVLLRDHFDGNDFNQHGDMRLRVPLSPIDQTSADRYLRVFGSGDWSQIDFRQFSRAITGKPEYDFSLDALFAATSAS